MSLMRIDLNKVTRGREVAELVLEEYTGAGISAIPEGMTYRERLETWAPLSRDQMRLDMGYWKRPLWPDDHGIIAEVMRSGIVRLNFMINAVVHWSPHQKGKIAFQDDPEKRKKDVWKVMKLGKFIQYVFSHSPLDIPPDHMIRDYAALVMDVNYNSVSNIEVKFAETRGDIVDVYVNGPHSCMGKPKGSSSFEMAAPYHPVEAYASGDWQVAYDPDYRFRAVCHKKSKKYYRIYAEDDSDKFMFKMALTKLGYEECYVDDWEEVVEEYDPRFLNLVSNQGFHAFPYIDGLDMMVYETPEGDLSLLDGIPVGGTQNSYDSDGVCEDGSDIGECCPCCGSRGDLDTYDHTTDEFVCDSCAENLVLGIVDHLGHEGHFSSGDAVEASDGAIFIDPEVASENDYVYVEFDGEWHPVDEVVITEDEHMIHCDDVERFCHVAKDTGNIFYYDFDLFEHEGEYYEFAENISEEDDDESETDAA